MDSITERWDNHNERLRALALSYFREDSNWSAALVGAQQAALTEMKPEDPMFEKWDLSMFTLWLNQGAQEPLLEFSRESWWLHQVKLAAGGLFYRESARSLDRAAQVARWPNSWEQLKNNVFFKQNPYDFPWGLLVRLWWADPNLINAIKNPTTSRPWGDGDVRILLALKYALDNNHLGTLNPPELNRRRYSKDMVEVVLHYDMLSREVSIISDAPEPYAILVTLKVKLDDLTRQELRRLSKVRRGADVFRKYMNRKYR